MNESVTDILKVIKSLRREVESLTKIVDSQHKEISQLNRNIQRLNKENRDLRERLSKYEKPPKNSSNSGIPPSKDDIPSEVIRRTQSLRPKSDKPTGRQKGHEGYTKDMVSFPDEIHIEESTYCQSCGKNLNEVKACLEYVNQEIELPVIRPVIKEHRYYSKVCDCGCQNQVNIPNKGGNRMIFGKRIQAFVVYLNVVQCVPYKRLQELMLSIFGVQMSQGTIFNIIQRAKKKAEPAIEIIKQKISKSPVVGFDESGCYCNKNLDWSWIAQTETCTLVFRESNRAGKVLENMFGSDLENIVAVTDRHSAYFSLNFKDHQICLAHILRELKYLTELDEKQNWSTKIQNILLDAIHWRKDNQKKSSDISDWLSRLDDVLKENIEHLKHDFQKLKKGLIKHRDHIFNFLKDPRIPFDNNGSERGIRKLKIKQKISGTFRSDEGADAFMDLHSITDTACKNNQSPLDAISVLF